MKTSRLIIMFSLVLLSISTSFGIVPNWYLSNPTVTAHGYTQDFTYGITQPGKVYVVLVNYNEPFLYSPATVRTAAINGPLATNISTWVLTVAPGDVNKTFTINCVKNMLGGNIPLLKEHDYTWYFVAEDAGGNLMATTKRIFQPTVCQAIDMDFGYTNPQQCINKGITQDLRFTIFNADPDCKDGTYPGSGVYPGTTVFIDWGDLTTETFVLTPMTPFVPKTFSHNYSSTTNCNYEIKATVTSSYNPTVKKQFKTYTVIHGRDIPLDGNGVMRIEENLTGLTTTIPVCEGVSHTITLKDMSTWNCQAPTFIDLTPAPANTSTRTIKWSYGVDYAGDLQNTIGVANGTPPLVLMSGVNSAEVTSPFGYVGPPSNPAAPGSLSETILIPSTCKAGEYFNVYLFNWNKCNVYPGEDPVITSIQILVVAAPAAPSITDTYVCDNASQTLTVSSAVVGKLKWYNFDKSVLLFTGAIGAKTYTPAKPIPSVTVFNVAEIQVGGNTCEGPSTPLTLTVYSTISNNSITSAAETICNGVIPSAIIATTPIGGSGAFVYGWEKSPDGTGSWTPADGTNTNKDYTPSVALTSSTWFRRAVTSGPCTSYTGTFKVTVNAAVTVGVINTSQTICNGATPAALTSTTNGTGTGTITYEWQVDNGGGYSTIAGATLATYAPGALTANASYKRRTKAVSTATCYSLYTTPVDITVNASVTPGTIGSDQVICNGSTPAGITSGSAGTGTGTITYEWQANGVTVGAAISATYSPGALASTTNYTRRTKAVSTATCYSNYTSAVAITVNATVTAGGIAAAQTICNGDTPAAFISSTDGTGSGTITYEWQADGVTIGGANSNTYAPGALTATTVYQRRTKSVSGGTTCYSGYTTSRTITVNASVTPGTIGSDETICNGTTPTALTSGSAGSGTGTITYEWQADNGGGYANIGAATLATYAPGSLVTTTSYKRRTKAVSTATCYSLYTTSVIKTVNNAVTAGAIGTSQTICNGDTPAALTSGTDGTGPGTLTYEWQANAVTIGGATSSTYSSGALVTTTTYQRRTKSVHAGITCYSAYTTPVTITVNAAVTTGTIGSDQTICNGTAPVALTSGSAGTGTGTITYEWQSDNGGGYATIGGATSATYSPGTLTTNTNYKRRTKAVSTATCYSLYTTPVAISVNSAVTEGAIGTSQVICRSTTPVALTSATDGTGPGALTYEWQANAVTIGGATSSTYAPGVLISTTVYQRRTKSVSAGITCYSAYATAVTITVNNAVTEGTIGNAQVICNNAVPAAISNAGAGTGSGVISYEWQADNGGGYATIGGATGATYSPPALLVTTNFKRRTVSLSGGTTCYSIYTTPVTITVNNAVTEGSIAAAQVICNGIAPAALTSSTDGTGSGAITYEWQANSGSGYSDIAGAFSSTYAPGALTITTSYQRRTKSVSGGKTCYSLYTVPVTITVNDVVTSGVIGTSHSICNLAIPTPFTSTTNGTGSGVITYEWQVDNGGGYATIGGANLSTYAPAALATTTSYKRRTVSVSGGTTCYSPYTTPVTVTVGIVPDKATLVPVATPVCAGVNAQILLTITDGVPPFNVTIDNGIGLSSIPGYTNTYNLGAALAPGNHSYNISSIVDNCGQSFAVLGSTATVVVNSLPDLTNGSATLCSDNATGVNLGYDNTGAFGITSVTYNINSITDGGLSFSAGAPAVGTGLASTITANDAWTNTTAANVGVIYNITPVSDKGCQGAAENITFTIQSEPKGQNVNINTCSDVALSYDLQASNINVAPGNSQAGTTFSWIAADNVNVTGESLVAQATGTINNTLNNVSGSDQTVVYTVTPTGSNGCTGNNFTVSVLVKSEPKGWDAAINTCSDVALSYNLQTSNINVAPGNSQALTTFSWIAADNVNVTGESLVAQATGTINNTLNNVSGSDQTVVYTVTPTGNNLCVGNTFTVTVTVKSEPKGANGTASTCSDVALNYDLQTSSINVAPGNSQAGTTFSWQAAANANVAGENTTAQTGAFITDNINNVSGSDQTVIYTVTPTGSNGCAGNTFTVTATIKSEPKGWDAAINTCSDVALSYDLQTSNINVAPGNSQAGTTFSWIAADNVNVTGESLVAQATGTINNTLNNVSGSDQTVVYTVTPTGLNGCVGNTFTVTVTVKTEPKGWDASINTCSDVALSYNLQTSNINVAPGNSQALTTFSWIAADNVNVTGESLVAQATGTINNTLNNVSGSDQTVVYTVTPTGNNLCVGNTFTVTVTVKSEPKGANGTASTCSDVALNYDLQTSSINVAPGNSQAGTTFSWQAAANANVTGENTTAQTGAFITDNINNVSGSDQTVIYTVTPTGSNGCVGNTFTVTATIKSEPKGWDAAINTCSDVALSYDLQTSNINVAPGNSQASNFSWVAAANGNVTGESTVAVATGTINDVLTNVTNVNQTVIYTVTPTGSVNGCVGNTFTVTVTVKPEPVGVDATTTACSDVAVGYNLQTSNINTLGNGLLSNFSWVAAANASVTGESTVAQTGTSISDVITNTTNLNQTVIYTVTPTGSVGGCAGNTFQITVTVKPEPVGVNSTANTCSDVALSYDLQTTNINGLGNGLLSTFSWVAAANASVSGESTGAVAGGTINDVLTNVTGADQIVIYTVTPTGSVGGCAGNTFQISVTVKSEPKGWDATATTCSDVALAYNLQTSNINVLPGNSQASNFSWVAAANGNVTGESTVAVATGTINDLLTNTSLVDQTIIYTVTPTGSISGCTGNTFTVTVTVKPSAAITPITYTTCSATPFTITPVDVTNGIVPAGTTYSWGMPVVSGGMTGGATGSGASLTGNLTNPTTTAQTATYTVTPTSSVALGSCVGSTFTVTITIDTKPAITAMSSSICSGSAFTVTPINVTNGVVPPGTTYTWGLPVLSGGITGEATGSGAANISGTLTNSTNIAQTATYTVTPSIGGCSGNNFTVTITVNPTPTVTDMTTAICSGGTFTSTPVNGTNGLVPAGTDYSWGIPVVTGGLIGGVAGSGSGITSTLTNPTNAVQTATYTVTPTSSVVLGSCVGSDFTVTVTFNPKPAINPLTTTICSETGFTMTPVNITDGIVPAGATYTWAAPAVSGGVTGGAAGSGALNISGTLTNPTNTVQTATYTVTPLSGTCSGSTFTVTVTVSPKPSITLMNATVCSTYGFTATPANGTNGIVPAGTTYSWAAPVVTGGMTGGTTGSGAANISGTLINTSGLPQTATYTVTPLSGSCTGTNFFVIVTVNPLPNVSAITGDLVICDDATNKVYQVVNHGATSSYTWIVPEVILDKTFDANLYFILIDAIGTTGSENIQVKETILSTGCFASSAPFNITVAPVNPGVLVAGPITVCQGATGVVYSVPENAGSVYSWIVPPGASITTIPADLHEIQVTFGSLGGQVSVTETATGGCLTIHTAKTVTVNPTPSITDMNSTICSGGAFTATPANGTNGTVPGGTTYTWPLPVVTGGMTGGAIGTAAANISGTLVNPTSTFQTATYTVTPVTGTCTGAPFTVTVLVNPNSAISNMTTTVCSAGTFTLTPADVTNGIVPAGTSYSWAAPAVTGGITGGAAGVNAAAISGTLINPTNTVATATYTVTPKSGTCTGPTFTVTVTVDPKPSISNMTATLCSAGSFTAAPADGVNGIVPGTTIYTWSAPSVTGGLTGGLPGTAAANISGTLTNPTNTTQVAIYTVTPVAGGCTGSDFTVTVTVNPMPAITNMVNTACSGVAFTSAPANGIDGVVPIGTTYTWAAPVVTGLVAGGAAGTNAANISGSLSNPTNILQTATYTVTPKSGSCTGVPFTVTVNVDPKPSITNMTATICSTGSFTSAPANGVNGVVPVGTTYTWAAPAVTGGLLGGAAGTNSANITGSLTNPTNTSQTAIYTITPKSGSCIGTPFTVTVTVDPKPAISNMTATICSGSGFTAAPVDGTNGIVPAATTYTWPLPVVTGLLTGGAAGTAAASISGTLTNPTSTVQTATYTVTPTSGSCPGATFTVIVTVNPMPAVNNLTALICSSGSFITTPVNLTDGIVPAGTTYTWPAPAISGSITGGAAGTNALTISGTLTNTSNTVQTATYTVTPKTGSCTGAIFTVTVTVNPKPAVTNMTATVCSAGTFTAIPVNGANGIVPGATTYTWGLPVVTGGITGGATGTGAANISGTLVNPTNAAQTATYSVTPATPACTGATFTVTVTVDPKPAIANLNATTCSNGTFTTLPVNGVDGIVPFGTIYTWPAPVVTGGITGEASGTAAANISGTLNNPTNTAQIATYTVTPTSGSCAGTAFTVIVTVNPMPAVTDMATAICSTNSFVSTPLDGPDGIVPAGTTYTWPAPVVTGGISGGAAGTNAADISGTLTNPTNSAQIATYTVTPKSGTCTGAIFTVIVTVNPKPGITNMVSTICSGSIFASTPLSGPNGIVPAGTTYTWSIPVLSPLASITGGAAEAVPQGNITQTLTNVTNAVATATYTVTPISGGCTGADFTVTVTVNPMPAVTAMASTICSGGNFTAAPANVTDGIVPAGTTYSWPLPVVSGGITGGAAGTNAISITGTLTNPTNIVQTATYTVTPKSGSCTGATFQVVVTVEPKATITPMTATICSAGTFTSVPTHGVNGVIPGATTYSWPAPVVSGGLTGGATGSGAANISGILTNPTSTAQTAIYTVTPLSGGCTGASFTVTVTVNPMPAITAMTATVCSDGTFTRLPADGINGIVPAGTTYTWAAPIVTGGITGELPGTAAANISGTLNNSTNIAQTATYTVFPTSGSCNGASFTVTVTVSPKPVIANMVSTICSSGSFTAAPANGVNGIVPAGTSYTWPAPVVSGGVTGGASGTGVPTIGGTLSNPTNSAQTATYTVTPVSGSCTGATFTVTVTVDPKPAITNMTAVICSAGTFVSTPLNGPNGIVPAATGYTWGAPTVTGGLTGGLAGAGANITGTLTNPTNTPQVAIYTVTPLAGTCTGNDFTVTVTVNPMPSVTNMTATICSTGTFTSVPANGIDGVVPSGTTYTWVAPVISGFITGGSSGTAAANISGTLTNTSNTVQTASYTVTPTSGSCSGADFTVVVTVNPKPAVTNMVATICSAGSFTSTPANGVNGLVPGTTTYTWPAPAVTGGITGGAAGTNAANISGTLVNPTNTVQQAVYTVTPTAAGCTGATFTVTVTVDPTPAVNPMVATVCSSTAFTSTPVNVTNGIVPGGTTYTWVAPVVTGGMSGGAGGTAASITGTLVNTTNVAQTATYTVMPTAGSCTGASFTLTVTVNPQPGISNMVSAICSGGSFTSTPANVTDGIVPAGTTYTWVAPIVSGGVTGGFGGGGSNITGTLTNPTNAIQTAIYTVTPTSGTCIGPDFTVTVTVNPKPAVTNMIATICSSGSFVSSPLDGSNGIVPVPTTYTWAAPTVSGGITGGAAGTAAANISGTLTNPTNTPQTAVYTVTPTAGSCTGATFTVTVTVNPKPSVSDITTTICSGSGFVSTPLNVTNGVVPAGTTYSWGAAVVTGGVTGGLAGSGSSISGTLINPTNITQTATYTVTPTSGTCVGANFTVTVTVNPKPGITNMTALICSGGTFTTVPADGVNGIVPASTTYTWSPPAVTGGVTGGTGGSGAVNINGTLNNPTNAVQTATYTVTPTSGGCTGATFTVTVTVDPKPAITNLTAVICSIGSFTTTPVNLTSGIVPVGTTYTWAAPTVTGGLTGGAAGGGAAISGTLSNPTNAPQIAVYTVTPTSGGCTGSTFTVTVTVDPTPAITPMTATICSSGSFNVSPVTGTDGIVPTGTTYTWLAPVVTGSIAGGLPGSGASINGTLINSTNTTQTATYTVTPTLGSCTGPAFTVTVTVNPKPAVTAMTATICSGGNFVSVPLNGTNGIVPAGTTYTWPVPVMTGGLTGGALGTAAVNITGTLVNPTNTVQTATYTVTPLSGGCTGATFTVTVTVNPMPNVSNMTASICSAGSFAVTPANFTNGVVPFGTTYSWASPAVTGGITGGAASSGPDVVGTLSNPTNTVQTATYTVTPTSGTCVGSTFTVTVTVNPMAAITAMTTTICNAASFTATPANGTNGIVPAGTSYTWGLPAVTGGMAGGVPGSGTGITGTLFNSTLSIQSATYTVTPISGSCTGAPFTVTVTVNPTTGPTNFTTGPPEVCQDGPDETYTATATNSTSILYSVLPAAAGTINATTGIMNWAPAFFGNATITATSSGLCGTTVGTVTVRVKQLPAITTSPVDRVICEFGQVNYDVTAAGSDLTYQWLVDPNTGTFAPVSGAVYTGQSSSTLQIWSADRSMNNYKYKVVVSGCLPDVTSLQALLTVNTAPELTVHPKDTTACLGANATMKAATLGTGIVWTWYVNKGSGGFVPVVADTQFSFATTTSGDTTKTTITITAAQLSSNNWIFRAQAKGTCGAPVNTNFGRLSVTNPPSVSVQPVLKVICENGNTSFLSNGSGYLSLQWQVSTNAGTSWTNLVDDAVLYVGTTTNQLSVLNAPVILNGNLYRLAFIGSCTTVNTNGVLLTVNPNPIVNFAADVNACGGVPVVLNGNPTGGILPYAQHRWTGDVGPLNNYIVQSPTFNSQISGTYNLNYRVTDSKGCTANDDLAVIVDSPSADFSQDINNGCTPLDVKFTMDPTGLAKFWWDFNDGSPLDSIQSSPTHHFVNSNPTTIGYYNVKLKVRSPGGCIKTSTALITVYPAIKPAFTATTDTVCSGKTITFTGVQGASKYFWDYGDGVSGYGGNTTTHLYVNTTQAPMDLLVKLTTTSFYSCNADSTIKIVVMPVPVPEFNASPVKQDYKVGGNPVTFTNLTNSGNFTYLWDFGDGTTSTLKDPSHNYTDLGIYDVTLEVTNGSCTAETMHQVSVVPLEPIAKFAQPADGCEPLNITFNNTSENTEFPGTTYRWDFGDGGTSAAKNPIYTYFDPGTYRIQLTVTGPGGDSDTSLVVNVFSSPKAYFEVAPTFVYVNDEQVRGFNLSQFADNYKWDFGDGYTSTEKEPYHKYMESGVYDITMWAFSNNGCSDKYVLSPGVTVEPAGEIRFATVFIPNLDGPIEGPPTTATMDQFFYPPIQEKVLDYKLQVFNRLGVLLFESRSVNIPWNGYYKGKLCTQGVYVWYVEGKYNNGKPFKKVGDITLLH